MSPYIVHATKYLRFTLSKCLQPTLFYGRWCVNVQGLVAGMNAARCAAGKPLVTFTREGSYIGTLIDDLITKVRAVGWWRRAELRVVRDK